MVSVQNNNLAVITAVPSQKQGQGVNPSQPKSGLSRIPRAVAGRICEFLSIQDRAQVHCVNKYHSQIIEKEFYGKLDMENKILCQ